MSDSEEIKPPQYTVYLAHPNAGHIMPCSELGVLRATEGKHNIVVNPMQFGDIEHNFNMLWCDALNRRQSHGVTHFAMIHTDISPEFYWLDKLIEEMDRLDADVMATIIAIKDGRGLTTTGIRYPGVWGTRRFVMREILRLPETFCITDTDEPDQILAINTGLWVCRLPAAGWPDAFPGFTCAHRLLWENGKRIPNFDSEDWLASDWFASQGLRVFATRKVQCEHIGAMSYGNQQLWGEWETELQRPPRPLTVRLPDPQITVETDHPIAVDSFDHTNPLGTARDNSINYSFNRKLFELIRAAEVRALDLGCAGGGFVRSILEAGGFSIGLEGSDYSLKNKRAEWATIPDYLFTCDLSKPFKITNCSPDPVKFNLFTAWEFFEHLAEDQIPAVVTRLVDHADEGALLIGSISRHPEPHHVTIHPKDWWIGFLPSIHVTSLSRGKTYALAHAPDLEAHFDNDLVRGSNNPGTYSFSVAFRLQVISDDDNVERASIHVRNSGCSPQNSPAETIGNNPS
jgi:hypothetical protein